MRARRIAIFVILLLAACACCMAGELCFVQMSDLHIKDQVSAQYLARAVEWLNNPETFAKKKPAFVVVTGDLSTSGLEEELSLCKAQLDKLKLAYYVIPGNHDISDEHPSFEKVFPGRTQYSMEVNGYKLLFHMGNTEPAVHDSVAPIRSWLQSEIEKTPKEMPVVLFTHHPYGKDAAYSVAGRGEIVKILKTRQVRAVLSGHFHGDTTAVEDGILFKTIPCLTNTRNNHDNTTAKGVMLYTVGPGYVSAKFVEFHDN